MDPTLSPNAFRCLIGAEKDLLMPVTEDLMYRFAVSVENITSDVIQACSIVTLNETDARLRAGGAFHEHVAVMIDPALGRENIVDAHLTFIPGDRFVIFRKDQDV